MFQTLWEQAPVCKCAGTGRMPVIGWNGRTVICSCGAGKHIAASGALQPGDMRWA